MKTFKQIEKEKQLIARCEKSIALEKLKNRRADTRRKIELGGLVIKSGIAQYDITVILGAMDYAFKLLEQNRTYELLFASRGTEIFCTDVPKHPF